MSPIQPEPKSRQMRQMSGWYTFSAKGRKGAVPSQSSQSSEAGTGAAFSGRVTSMRETPLRLEKR